MIDLHDLRARPETYQAAADNKGIKLNIAHILALDEQRRELTKVVEEMRAQKNAASKRIPQLKDDERSALIAEMKALGEELKAREDELAPIEEEWNGLIAQVPNLPLPVVPVGHSEDENVEINTWGSKPQFDFEPRDHVALGKLLDIIDVEQAAVVSGSRFAYLKGDAVRLQMAIIQFTLNTLGNAEVLKDIAAKADLKVSTKPFVPVLPPVIMQREVMDRMDRLQPEDQRYVLPEDGQVLIGSAEHTLGPYFMEKTLEISQLPIRFIGYSSAFRREAGTYGKDMGGILRVHQFDKLEMESFTSAEDGETEQQFIVAIQEYLVQALGIPYRLLQKCTYDIGKPNANGLDIECWIPSQNKYRETHTSDYMTDYQARRLGTFYKDVDGQRRLVHMNDATAFAIGRTLIAILENYQQKDGSVVIPEALRPYMGGKEAMEPMY